MKRILVTGAGGSSSFNFIKSLRDNPSCEKFYIVGVDEKKYHLELVDLDAKYVIPSVKEASYLSVLNKIIKKEKIDFLHAQPDQEVYFLSKNRKHVKTKTLLPSFETVAVCQNKMQVQTILKKHKVPTPQVYSIKSKADLKEGLVKLFKTNKKVWLRAVRGAGSKAALPVENFEHAKMWIDYWQKMKGLQYNDFMVTEFLPGKEYAFQSMWLKGKLLASQARERVEYLFGHLFVSGQSSTPSVAVTVNNDKVNNVAYEAVKAVDSNATGIFCVDLKTAKDGKIVPIEINAGRFFTTSYFFSKAGCNMPYYYVLLGIDKNVKIPLKPFNNLPSNLYWIRMVDMGYALIKGDKWTSFLLD